jgi:hypothetical protein
MVPITKQCSLFQFLHLSTFQISKKASRFHSFTFAILLISKQCSLFLFLCGNAPNLLQRLLIPIPSPYKSSDLQTMLLIPIFSPKQWSQSPNNAPYSHFFTYQHSKYLTRLLISIPSPYNSPDLRTMLHIPIPLPGNAPYLLQSLLIPIPSPYGSPDLQIMLLIPISSPKQWSQSPNNAPYSHFFTYQGSKYLTRLLISIPSP